MRTQILDYFMYKYREGQLEETDGLLRELPYDLQVCNPDFVVEYSLLFLF